MEYENIAAKVMTSLQSHCSKKGYELSALMGALNVEHLARLRTMVKAIKSPLRVQVAEGYLSASDFLVGKNISDISGKRGGGPALQRFSQMCRDRSLELGIKYLTGKECIHQINQYQLDVLNYVYKNTYEISPYWMNGEITVSEYLEKCAPELRSSRSMHSQLGIRAIRLMKDLNAKTRNVGGGRKKYPFAILEKAFKHIQSQEKAKDPDQQLISQLNNLAPYAVYLEPEPEEVQLSGVEAVNAFLNI